jgi:hypothetical protein
MQVSAGAESFPDNVTLLRHMSASEDDPAVGCVVPCSADSFALVLPRPVSIDRSPYDVIRVCLASSLAAVAWHDLDAVLFSDAACLLCLPWLSKRVSRLTTIVCSNALLRLAPSLLHDVFLGQHVSFEVAAASTTVFVTPDLLADCIRMLSPVFRLSPLHLLGGGTLYAFCSGADPGSVGWVISRCNAAGQVVVSRQHCLQQSMAFGAVDDIPAAPPTLPRRCIAMAGVDGQAVAEAACAARAALAAGGCVLGIAPCPFAIARFVLLLQDTTIPLFWMGEQSEGMYGCLHTLAEYCRDDMLRLAYGREAPFTLANQFGEISTVTQQDLTCGTACVVVALCPPADYVSAWTFLKPTANVVLRFQ